MREEETVLDNLLEAVPIGNIVLVLVNGHV